MLFRPPPAFLNNWQAVHEYYLPQTQHIHILRSKRAVLWAKRTSPLQKLASWGWPSAGWLQLVADINSLRWLSDVWNIPLLVFAPPSLYHSFRGKFCFYNLPLGVTPNNVVGTPFLLKGTNFIIFITSTNTVMAGKAEVVFQKSAPRNFTVAPFAEKAHPLKHPLPLTLLK